MSFAKKSLFMELLLGNNLCFIWLSISQEGDKPKFVSGSICWEELCQDWRPIGIFIQQEDDINNFERSRDAITDMIQYIVPIPSDYGMVYFILQ